MYASMSVMVYIIVECCLIVCNPDFSAINVCFQCASYVVGECLSN